MASEIKVDTISEKTSAGGVTIDGLLIKDGGISGDVSLIGTTPTFTIGDAGAEDATLLFDGNAQDYHVGLDDTSDSLVIGLGSALGTTPAMTINSSQVVTFAQNTVFPDGGVAVADLDIDGATDIGAAIVDADLFIVDDGAGGTNRKVTASRIKTYAGGASTLGALTDVTMDATNFTDSLLIQTNSDGSAPGTGTLSSANDNIGIGKNVFAALTSGDDNVVIGNAAGAALTSGVRNILIGSDAGAALTTATDAIFIGNGAGDGHDAETRNIGIGLNALGGAIDGGEYNVAIGHNAGASLTEADKNILIGDVAGDAITTGGPNIFIGYDAGGATTTGTQNFFIGMDAGDANTTGTNNIGIGTNSVGQPDTENDNIGIGYSALGGAISGGEENIAIGRNAGTALTSADNCVFIGFEAGNDVTSGASNTCVGHGAGDKLADGGRNTCIGHDAGSNVITGNDNVFVGDSLTVSSTGVGNAIALGYDFVIDANNFSFGKASNVVTNDFDSDADWSRSSDLRLKRNIQDSTLGLDFINDLRPIKFQWKPSNEIPKEMKSEYNEENKKNLDITSHGFIAQEVKEAIDKHGDTTFGGWHLDKTDNETQRVKKNMFVMPLINAVQELSSQIKTLQDEIKTLKGE